MPQANNQFTVSAPTSGHPVIKFLTFVFTTFLWFVVGLIVIEAGSATLFQPVFAQIADFTSASVNDTTSELRYTTIGWQDPSDWMPQPQQGGSLNLSSVNPLIWTALLLLAVGIALIWFSSEDEVDRLFRERLEKSDLLEQWDAKQKA